MAQTLNAEQKDAVKFIVEAHNRPMPFLLFGPPGINKTKKFIKIKKKQISSLFLLYASIYFIFGSSINVGTGKTRTIVAAIEEIVRTTDKCILVCAQSNSACDEITNRLLNVLQHGEMIRMFAKTFNSQNTNAKIRAISNLTNGHFQIPCLRYLYSFRVVVCTLQTAGCITRAREKDDDFDASHFSHIIIDEAAFVHETTTMISIAGIFLANSIYFLLIRFAKFEKKSVFSLGLCTEIDEVKSSIILAGDPKQLDGVTKSNFASRLGFRKSYMEFLSEKPLYKRNPAYNPIYIVQLTKNYRSEEAILETSNHLFYDQMLEASATGK